MMEVWNEEILLNSWNKDNVDELYEDLSVNTISGSRSHFRVLVAVALEKPREQPLWLKISTGVDDRPSIVQLPGDGSWTPALDGESVIPYACANVKTYPVFKENSVSGWALRAAVLGNILCCSFSMYKNSNIGLSVCMLLSAGISMRITEEKNRIASNMNDCKAKIKLRLLRGSFRDPNFMWQYTSKMCTTCPTGGTLARLESLSHLYKSDLKYDSSRDHFIRLPFLRAQQYATQNLKVFEEELMAATCKPARLPQI